MGVVNIQKRYAIVAYNKADSKEKALLENLFGKELFNQNITARIKTMDDVYSELGVDKSKFENSKFEHGGLCGTKIQKRRF